MGTPKIRRHRMVTGLLIIYLILPILATFIYSIASEWSTTLMPEGYTFNWYQTLFTDSRFWQAMGRSLMVSAFPILISMMAMMGVIFVVAVYLPQFEKMLQAVVLIPYVIPGVVLAISLIRVYDSTLGGTVWLLILAYSVMILPYMYQGIRNSLRTINVKQLVEACEILGATKTQAFVKVVVPNILPGIKVSVLLSFSVLFGEFALVNLLIGGNYETVQMLLYNFLKESGHTASALVSTYFAIVLIISYTALRLSKNMEAHGVPSDEQVITRQDRRERRELSNELLGCE